MRLRILTIAFAIAVIAIASGASSLLAQGPLYDKVVVNLPYRVSVNDRVLEPGEYVIRQLPSASNSRVLLIYSDNGMKFETSAMTIPTLDNRTPEDTKVVLHRFGDDYYFDKIWIQGKNYGYEFPLSDAVKARERERMASANISARYEPITAEGNKPAESTTAQSTTTTKESTTETARTTPPAPAPQPSEQAQPQQPSTTAAEPAPSQPAVSADRSLQQETAQMPRTAGNWLTLLLSGSALGGAGFALRRALRR